MMSEAITLILADILWVDIYIKNHNYDTTKRKIHPIIQHSNISTTKLNDIKQLAYANCCYAVFGNLNLLYTICNKNSSIQNYNEKYKTFFGWDFLWNNSNVLSIFEKYKSFIHIEKYQNALSYPKYQYTTKELSNNISDNWKYSFEKLFEILWQQFEEAIIHLSAYNKFSILKNKRILSLKYLSGQIFLRYQYENELKKIFCLDSFDSKFQNSISIIKTSSSIAEIINECNKIQNDITIFIKYLKNNQYILPHEATTFLLHVNHFDPTYINYDSKIKKYDNIKMISSWFTQDFIQSWNLITVPETIENIYSFLMKNEQ